MSATSFSVTQPIAITEAMLISSNIPETDHAPWAGTTTYALGARVVLPSTHRVYESLQAGNVGRHPATNPDWWIEAGPTNRWKAFDTRVSSQTVGVGSPAKIAYVLRLGQSFDTLAVLNVALASSMRVRLVDPVYGTVYDRTTDFGALPVNAGWWSWFFGQRLRPSQGLCLDLPAYPGADLMVDLEGAAGLAVGVLLVGQRQTYGLGTQYGARVGIQDYSRKETNEFGSTELVTRAFAKRASFDVLIERHEVDPLQDFLASIRAVPCLYIGATDYQSTVIFGFYKNFEIVIAYPTTSDCSIDIEGLT